MDGDLDAEIDTDAPLIFLAILSKTALAIAESQALAAETPSLLTTQETMFSTSPAHRRHSLWWRRRRYDPRGSGDDTLFGGSGDDTIEGRDGNDRISATPVSTLISALASISQTPFYRS